jgi:glycosyltransferase involved in cell wall biosynthesis
MRFGIDISQIAYHGTGVATFTRGLVQAILQYDKKNHWTFFFSSLRNKLDAELVSQIKSKNHDLKILPIPPTLLSYMWNNFHLAHVELFTDKLDWFISSDWTEPPASCKKITIVHDLAFKRYPETVDPTIIATHEKRLNWVAKESSLILADSYATKNDLKEYYAIDEKRIAVIYPGVELVNTKTELPKDVLKRFNISKPYILTVGKIEPRKNLKRLIEAFNKLENPNIELCIVGPQGWDNIEGLKTEHIKFLGYVSEEERTALYKNCLFFIYPSIWEGFGYPPVEAMQLGIPVALSNNSSLTEIGKEAGYLFDPLNVENIRQALYDMVSNESLRNELAIKGKEKSKQYNWKNYFEEMMKEIEKKS